MDTLDQTLRTICGGDATVTLTNEPSFVTIATGTDDDTISINPLTILDVNSETDYVFTVT